MVTKKVLNRIVGALLLGLLGVIVSTIALGSLDPSAEAFHETFQNLVENQGKYLANVVILHGASVLALALAAGSYLAFRPYGQALALLGAIGLLALGFTLAIANIGGGMLTTIAEEYATTPPVTTGPLIPSARIAAMLSLFAWYDGLFTFLPLSLLAMGALIAQSGALPRWLGWLAIADGAVMPLIWLITPPIFHLGLLSRRGNGHDGEPGVAHGGGCLVAGARDAAGCIGKRLAKPGDKLEEVGAQANGQGSAL